MLSNHIFVRRNLVKSTLLVIVCLIPVVNTVRPDYKKNIKFIVFQDEQFWCSFMTEDCFQGQKLNKVLFPFNNISKQERYNLDFNILEPFVLLS